MFARIRCLSQHFRKVVPPVLLTLLLFGVGVAPGSASEVTIYRDSYGVPSIVSDSVPDAVYGLGYAQTMDNAERIALNYKLARGRLAEVMGKPQLLIDGFVRSLDFEGIAENSAKNLDKPMQAIVSSYLAGANKALAEQKGKLPAWIQPFTATDMLALAQLVNAAFALQSVANQIGIGLGSNQFAVAPSRSATGHPILSMDPHLTWEQFFLWDEFALYTKEFKFRGIGISGLPFGNMGHTEYVAWSMTNNDPSLAALYTIRYNPKNNHQYSYHGEWRNFVEKQIELRYLEDGKMKTQKQLVLLTEWGPMVPLRPLAAKLSMLGAVNSDEVFDMMRAKNAKEFRAALKPHTISMWNIVYADTKGNIGYQFNARCPRRDPLYDWRQPVPGDDPGSKWGDLLDNDELPHILNPRSGLLCNCNSAPWLTPIDDEMKTLWPGYVTTYQHTTRYDLLSALLKQAPRISVEQAKHIATDTEVPYAKAATQALLHFGANDPALAPALEVLSAWNAHADIDAKGCGLYAYWLLADHQNAVRAQKVAELKGWTPQEAKEALASLQTAAENMRRDHGRLDIAWGDMHYMERGEQKAPVLGYGYLGSGLRDASVAPNFGPFLHGDIRCRGGSSWRMIVSLDPKGIQSWSALPYGESQNPASPHYADQMALFGRGEYKPTHFGIEGAKQSAVSRQVLQR